MARIIIIIIIKDMYDVPDLFRNTIVVGMCNNNSCVNRINQRTRIDTPLHTFTHAHARAHTCTILYSQVLKERGKSDDEN